MAIYYKLTHLNNSGREDFNGRYDYAGNTIRLNNEEGEEYDSNDEEVRRNKRSNDVFNVCLCQDNTTPDWPRDYSNFSQPNALCRIPSHNNEEYEEDFEELEKKEEDFGDFESATNEITNQMEALDVNKNNDVVKEEEKKSETSEKHA